MGIGFRVFSLNKKCNKLFIALLEGTNKSTPPRIFCLATLFVPHVLSTIVHHPQEGKKHSQCPHRQLFGSCDSTSSNSVRRLPKRTHPRTLSCQSQEEDSGGVQTSLSTNSLPTTPTLLPGAARPPKALLFPCCHYCSCLEFETHRVLLKLSSQGRQAAEVNGWWQPNPGESNKISYRRYESMRSLISLVGMLYCSRASFLWTLRCLSSCREVGANLVIKFW